MSTLVFSLRFARRCNGRIPLGVLYSWRNPKAAAPPCEIPRRRLSGRGDGTSLRRRLSPFLMQVTHFMCVGSSPEALLLSRLAVHPLQWVLFFSDESTSLISGVQLSCFHLRWARGRRRSVRADYCCEKRRFQIQIGSDSDEHFFG